MEKTITIDGKQVKLKANAASAKRYKAQFRRDLFADMFKLGAIGTFASQDATEGTIDFSNLDFDKVDFEVCYDLVWLYAKTADPEIPDPMTWLEGFDEFPIYDIMPEINEMVQKTMGAKKKILSLSGLGGMVNDFWSCFCFALYQKISSISYHTHHTHFELHTHLFPSGNHYSLLCIYMFVFV
mgnify:CR=1 FL=1